MIFISYTQSDSAIVDEIAKNISAIFGEKNIFYDKWSIQPGDGILDKMNEGLDKCKFFFFFVSKNSLKSNMVKLEWQNALFKKTKNDQMKFIPVKLDDCIPPSILLQTLYIDVFNRGINFGITNIIEVISGGNISKVANEFHNIHAYVNNNGVILTVEFKAEYYTEPQSRYLILLENKNDEIDFKAVGEGIFYPAFYENFELDNGLISNAVLLGRDSSTSPGFPFVVEITAKNNSRLNFRGAMRATSRERYIGVPIIDNS